MTEQAALKVISGDRGPWLRDNRGRPLPRNPVRGLRIDAHWAETPCMFDRWSIVTVTRARFVARHAGREFEGPLDAWGAWLRGLGPAERLGIHWPGCDIGWCTCAPPLAGPTCLIVIK
jgi:hypothetical protein